MAPDAARSPPRPCSTRTKPATPTLIQRAAGASRSGCSTAVHEPDSASPLGWPTPNNLRMRPRPAGSTRSSSSSSNSARREGVGDRTTCSRCCSPPTTKPVDGTGMTDAQPPRRGDDPLPRRPGDDRHRPGVDLVPARHNTPRSKRTLVAELRANSATGRLTVDDVPRLKYAEAVITESMRLHPPAYILGREAIRDTRSVDIEAAVELGDREPVDSAAGQALVGRNSGDQRRGARRRGWSS